MYTREFAEWIIKQKGQATWDIYSSNITAEAKSYLQLTDTSLIRFHGGINYFSLPGLLHEYEVGVILYKGHIPNYVYNAPNKLFEYLACGLDVWFPQNMQSSLPFVTKDNYPKIVPVNFENLMSLNLTIIIDRAGLVSNKSVYYCEQKFDYLLKQYVTF